MVGTVAIIGIFAGFFTALALIVAWIVIVNKSYKYRAIIFRRIGDEYIPEIDKFRMKQRPNKMWVIEFKKRVRDNMPLVDGRNMVSLWFNKKKNAYRMYEMNDKQIKKSLKNGALFVQHSPQDLKPATFDEASMMLKAIPQDMRPFLIDELRQQKEFSKDPKGRWAEVLKVVAPIFIVMLVMLIMWIIFNNQMTENIALLCEHAKASSSSGGGNAIIDTITSVGG